MEIENIKRAIKRCDYNALLDWIQNIYHEDLSPEVADRIGELGIEIYLEELNLSDLHKEKIIAMREAFDKSEIIKKEIKILFSEVESLCKKYNKTIKSNDVNLLTNRDAALCHNIDDTLKFIQTIKLKVDIEAINSVIKYVDLIIKNYDQTTEVVTSKRIELNETDMMLRNISGTRPHIFEGEKYNLFLIIKSYSTWKHISIKLNELRNELSNIEIKKNIFHIKSSTSMEIDKLCEVLGIHSLK